MLITEAMVGATAQEAGLGETVRIQLLKQENDIAAIHSDTGTFFLKTYTKPWYGGDIAATGGCVEHEAEARRTLAAAGLGVPEVIAAETGTSNPLGRPYLITRALAGRSLTELLSSADDRSFEQLFYSTGHYLAGMHAITYRYAGYVMPGEPSTPPDPAAWQHGIWTFEVFRREAERTWLADEHEAGAALLGEVRAFAEQHWDALAAAHINYTCYGEYAWPGTRAEILRRVLDARDWNSLSMNPVGV